MRGKHSVKQALETVFENGIFEKYKCIGCMKSVLASKRWNLLSTPKVLCLTMNYQYSSQYKVNAIEINRNLILKCSAETRARYWKYELATVVDHAGQCSDKNSNFNNSTVKEKYAYVHRNPSKLFYERVEVIVF